MRKHYVVGMLVCIIGICAAGTLGAVERPERTPFKAPQELPAEIQGFRYIAGPVAAGRDPGASDYPKVSVALTKKEFEVVRQRMDPDTVKERARKLEKIALAQIPYKKIVEVWYGEEALKKIAVTNIPDMPMTIWDYRSQAYQPLNVFLDQRNRAPVIVLYDGGKKQRGAVILMGSEDKGMALYSMLMQQKGKKKK